MQYNGPEFTVSPNGNFTYRGTTYYQLDDDADPDSNILDAKYPHLFYISDEGFIKTRYPNLVDTTNDEESFSINIMGKKSDKYYKWNDTDTNVEVIFPLFTDSGIPYCSLRSFPTMKAMRDYNRQCPPDIDRILRVIDPGYLRYLYNLEICYTPINNIPLNRDICPYLEEVVLVDCNLTEFPQTLARLNLTVLDLSHNPQLKEIPYNYLKFSTPQLAEIKLRRTGIKCLWLPQWTINNVDVHTKKSAMRGLINLEEKLYRKWWEDYDCDDCDTGTAINLIELISAKSAAPVINAAVAIMGIYRFRRGIIPALSKDIAVMISRMVLETKGCAKWSTLAQSEPIYTEKVIQDIKKWSRNRVDAGLILAEVTDESISNNVSNWIVEDIMLSKNPIRPKLAAAEVVKRQKTE